MPATVPAGMIMMDTRTSPSSIPHRLKAGSTFGPCAPDLRRSWTCGSTCVRGSSTAACAVLFKKSVTDIVTAALDKNMLKTSDVQAIVTSQLALSGGNISAVTADVSSLSLYVQTLSGKVQTAALQLDALAQKTTAEASELAALKLRVAGISHVGGGASFYPPLAINTLFSSQTTSTQNLTTFDFLPSSAGYFNLGPTLDGANAVFTYGYKTLRDTMFRDADGAKSSKEWLATMLPAWTQGQGCLTVPVIQTAPGGPTVSPFFFLPLAQCWGGSVMGHLDISFYVAVPPAAPSHKFRVAIFNGYPGRGVDGGPISNDPSEAPGTLAKSPVTGNSKNPLTIWLKCNALGLVNSPVQRLKVPISYDRKAPPGGNCIDNQYFGMIYSDSHDPKVCITDITISLIASAATATITPGWSGSVPADLTA